MQLIKTIEFQEHLAHLFYAIAIVDGKIEPTEKRAIIAVVDEHWIEEDEVGKEQHVIYTTLKGLIAAELESETAWIEFKNYYLSNKENFSTALKNKILNSIDFVAQSFANRNKSELVLLSRVQLLFDQDSV